MDPSEKSAVDAEPCEFTFETDDTALLVIDM